MRRSRRDHSSTSNSDVKGSRPAHDRGVGRPRAPLGATPRRSPLTERRTDPVDPIPEQSSSTTLPRITRYARQRWDHPHHRQATGPTVATPAYDRQWRFAYAKRSRSFEFVSREPTTFASGRDPRHDADSAVQASRKAGPGGSQRETAGGKRVRASPPMSRALWSGARRSASIPSAWR